MRTRILSDKEGDKIVGMRQIGMKCKDISSVLNMLCFTIYIVITNWKLTRCMVIQKPGHRLRLLTNRAFCDLLCELQQDWSQPLTMIAKSFYVTHNTI